jgi:hypothetical protein
MYGRKGEGMYTAIVVLLMIALPAGSIVADLLFFADGAPLMLLVGKWYVFWAAGWRLLLAGFKQISQPAFTAHEIFRMKTDEALPIVRELGFANASLGLLGVTSLWATSFALPVAIAGAIFYGSAGVQHFTRKDKSDNETLATATDLLAFAILGAYVLYVWFA